MKRLSSCVLLLFSVLLPSWGEGLRDIVAAVGQTEIRLADEVSGRSFRKVACGMRAAGRDEEDSWTEWTQFGSGTYYLSALPLWADEAHVDMYVRYDSQNPDTVQYCFDGFWRDFFADDDTVTTTPLVITRDRNGELCIPFQLSDYEVAIDNRGNYARLCVSDYSDFIEMYRESLTPEALEILQEKGSYDDELGLFRLSVVYWLYYDGFVALELGPEICLNDSAWTEYGKYGTGQYSHVFFAASDDEEYDSEDNVQEMTVLSRTSVKSGRYTEFHVEDWGAGLASRSGVPVSFVRDNITDEVLFLPFGTGWYNEIADDDGTIYEIETFGFSADELNWKMGYDVADRELFRNTWLPDEMTMSLDIIYCAFFPEGFVLDGTDMGGSFYIWTLEKPETLILSPETSVIRLPMDGRDGMDVHMIYDMSGQSVRTPVSGRLYIVNGNTILY